MPIINLDSVTNPKLRVKAIGVELEGGWPASIDFASGLQRDGSVQFAREFTPEQRAELQALRALYDRGTISMSSYERRRFAIESSSPKPDYTGEFSSPPLAPAELIEWLPRYYPPFVNHTCGMHLHISFKSAFVYQRLIVPDFQDTLVEYVRRWAEANLPDDHHIYSRLRGESQYATFNYWPDAQIAATSKDYHHRQGNRYTAVHYCWGRFRTIEIRLLPMMPTVEIAQNAILMVIDVVNKFLVATTTKREPALITSGLLTLDTEQRSYIECV